MKKFYIVINLSENKDQKSGTSFLLAEQTERKNMPIVMAALSQGIKPNGDTFVFRLGSTMSNQVVACANNNELIELDLSEFKTQQNGLDGNKPLYIYNK